MHIRGWGFWSPPPPKKSLIKWPESPCSYEKYLKKSHTKINSWKLKNWSTNLEDTWLFIYKPNFSFTFVFPFFRKIKKNQILNQYVHGYRNNHHLFTETNILSPTLMSFEIMKLFKELYVLMFCYYFLPRNSRWTKYLFPISQS